MSMNFPTKVIKYVIHTISSCEQKILELGKKKISSKYKWGYCGVIKI